MFDCDRCGICCKHIAGIPHLVEYDNGFGECMYLDENNLCRIYTSRPLMCNVDEYYNHHLINVMSRESWYRINEEACTHLKRMYMG